MFSILNTTLSVQRFRRRFSDFFRNTATQIIGQRLVGRAERDLRFRLDRARTVFQNIAAVAFHADARRIAFRAVRRTGDPFHALAVLQNISGLAFGTNQRSVTYIAIRNSLAARYCRAPRRTAVRIPVCAQVRHFLRVVGVVNLSTRHLIGVHLGIVIGNAFMESRHAFAGFGILRHVSRFARKTGLIQYIPFVRNMTVYAYPLAFVKSAFPMTKISVFRINQNKSGGAVVNDSFRFDGGAIVKIIASSLFSFDAQPLIRAGDSRKRRYQPNRR